jgi:hypothetical protein
MKYAAEMDSGAMIYLPNFTQIGSGTQKLTVGNTQRHRQHCDLMSLLLFLQNEECVIKNKRHESAMFKCKTLTFFFYLLVRNKSFCNIVTSIILTNEGSIAKPKHPRAFTINNCCNSNDTGEFSILQLNSKSHWLLLVQGLLSFTPFL